MPLSQQNTDKNAWRGRDRLCLNIFELLWFWTRDFSFRVVLHISVHLRPIYYDDGSRGYFIPRAEAKAVTRSEVYKFVGIRPPFDSHEDRWLWLDIFSLSAYRFQPSTVA